MEAHTLSEEETRDLLSRLERVQPIGSFVERPPYSVGNATRMTRTDLYEQAIMSVTVYGNRRLVMGFEIGYFRTIYGRVERKALGSMMGSVVVDGESYSVTKEEWARLVVGAVGPIRVAQVGALPRLPSRWSPSPANCLK
jgi:hypothetical protein